MSKMAFLKSAGKIIAAAFSVAVFVYARGGGNFPLLLFCFTSFLLFFWVIYSKSMSGGQSTFFETLKQDSNTYLPALLLLLFLVTVLLRTDRYRGAFMEYYAYAFVITFSVAGIASLKILTGKNASVQRLATPLILLAVGAAFLFYYRYLMLSHYAFSEDSWYYHNLIWNISKLNFQHSGSDLDIVTSIFSTHMSLFAFPLAFIYSFFRDIRTLVFMQSLVLALGIVPVWFYAARSMKNCWAGIAFALAYVLHPAIQFGHFWGITLDMFGVVFLTGALYFLFSDKLKAFFVCCLLTIACKEIFAVIIAPLGIYVFIVRREKKVGLWLFVSSTLYFLIAMQIASYMGKGIDVHGFFKETLWYLASHPAAMLRHYLDPRRLDTVIKLLAPLGFLSLVRPGLLLVGLPFLLISFLDPSFYLLDSYRFSPMAPLIIFSAINAVVYIRKRTADAMLFQSMLVYLAIVSTASYYFYNPFIFFKQYYKGRFAKSAHFEAVAKIANTVPEDASLSVSSALRGMFARRREIYIFPRGPVSEKYSKLFNLPEYKHSFVRDADYVVVDLTYPHSLCGGHENEYLRELLDGPDYGVLYYFDGLIVFKKGHQGRFQDFVTVEDTPAIENIFNKDLSESLNFMGYNIEREKAFKGQTVYMEYFLRVKSPIFEKYRLALTFKRPGYRDINIIHEPFRGMYSSDKWGAGVVLRDHVAVGLDDNFSILSVPYSMDIVLLEETGVASGLGEFLVLPRFR